MNKEKFYRKCFNKAVEYLIARNECVAMEITDIENCVNTKSCADCIKKAIREQVYKEMVADNDKKV